MNEIKKAGENLTKRSAEHKESKAHEKKEHMALKMDRSWTKKGYSTKDAFKERNESLRKAGLIK